jgi:hypothetical protein
VSYRNSNVLVEKMEGFRATLVLGPKPFVQKRGNYGHGVDYTGYYTKGTHVMDFRGRNSGSAEIGDVLNNLTQEEANKVRRVKKHRQ